MKLWWQFLYAWKASWLECNTNSIISKLIHHNHHHHHQQHYHHHQALNDLEGAEALPALPVPSIVNNDVRIVTADEEASVGGIWDYTSSLGGGGGKMKEISMKNASVKVLITNRIIWNSKQKNKQYQTRQQYDINTPYNHIIMCLNHMMIHHPRLSWMSQLRCLRPLLMAPPPRQWGGFYYYLLLY